MRWKFKFTDDFLCKHKSGKTLYLTIQKCILLLLWDLLNLFHNSSGYSNIQLWNHFIQNILIIGTLFEVSVKLIKNWKITKLASIEYFLSIDLFYAWAHPIRSRILEWPKNKQCFEKFQRNNKLCRVKIWQFWISCK